MAWALHRPARRGRPALRARQRGFINLALLDRAPARPSFFARLTHSLIPDAANGSPTPTFTRTTTKYIADCEGRLVQILSGEAGFTGARRVYNLVATKSEDFTNAAWTKTSTTATATTLTATGANATTIAASAITSASQLHVMRVRLSRITGSGNVQLTLDNGSTWTTVTLTGSSKVFSINQTLSNPQPGIRIVTSGDAINADQIQVEGTLGQSNTNPSDYASVGVLSTPYHGAGVDGVKWFNTLNGNTVAGNVVTQATGAKITSAASGASSATTDAYGPLGFSQEESATNVALRSEDLTATWASVGGAGTPFTANTTVAPNGTTTMDTFTEDTGSSAHKFYQSQVIASGATSCAIWLAPGTRRYVILAMVGTNNVYCVVDTQTWTITETGGTGTYIGSGIDAAGIGTARRVRLTGNVSNGGFTYLQVQGSTSATPGAIDPSYTGTSATIIAWGAQMVTGNKIGSYIPTTSSSVTRNADVLTFPSASNIADAAGTCYAEITTGNANTQEGDVVALSGNLALATVSSTGGQYKADFYDGTNDVQSSSAGGASGTIGKIAATWNGTRSTVYLNGVATTGAYDGTLISGATTLSIGQRSGGSGSINGTIRNLRIYGRELTAAQIARIPTL